MAENGKAKAPEEATKKEVKEETGALGVPVLIAFGLVIAVAGALLQQQELVSGQQSPQRWAASLFEPFVAPPPPAGKDEVVIQFCAS